MIPIARHRGLLQWRKALFAFLARNFERTAAYFGVPACQAVELGLEIEL